MKEEPNQETKQVKLNTKGKVTKCQAYIVDLGNITIMLASFSFIEYLYITKEYLNSKKLLGLVSYNTKQENEAWQDFHPKTEVITLLYVCHLH